jgi:hypothetical protein
MKESFKRSTATLDFLTLFLNSIQGRKWYTRQLAELNEEP